MRLSQKKNCEGCRAMTFSVGSGSKCELGFNNRGPYIKSLGIYRIQPQEPCYKPRTYDEMIEAQRLVWDAGHDCIDIENKPTGDPCAACKAGAA